jgi:hydroxyacylglutathione hydrolase
VFIAGFPTGMLSANCYVVAQQAGAPCVVIDPGEDALESLRELLSSHSLQPVAVLLTHGHLDHAASLRTVSEEFGIPGYLHTADHYMLDDPLSALSPELRAALVEYSIPHMRPAELRSLAGSHQLEFPDLRLTVISTPGHTGGSVVFRISGNDRRPEVLFTGDTLFAGSVGRTDLPGGNSSQLQLSLRRLLAEPEDAIVLPGHGARSTLGAERRTNPFLMAASSSAES